MTPLQDLTVEQLRKLVAIREQIDTLQGEIALIAGGESAAPMTPLKGRGRGKSPVLKPLALLLRPGGLK
jgi:hypothetical protein